MYLSMWSMFTFVVTTFLIRPIVTFWWATAKGMCVAIIKHALQPNATIIMSLKWKVKNLMISMLADDLQFNAQVQ